MVSICFLPLLWCVFCEYQPIARVSHGLSASQRKTNNNLVRSRRDLNLDLQKVLNEISEMAIRFCKAPLGAGKPHSLSAFLPRIHRNPDG